MTLLEAAKQILTGQKPPIDIWHYLVGNYRYRLYYDSFAASGKLHSVVKHSLMRQHIWEQINYRLKIMNQFCYENGSCIKCGCNTTELQMASKTCKGLEYPPMMNKDQWYKYINNKYVPKHNGNIWVFTSLKEQPLLYRTNPENHVFTNRA